MREHVNAAHVVRECQRHDAPALEVRAQEMARRDAGEPHRHGAGVGDAAAGKAVDKCAATIRKAGAKLTSTRLKQLGACEKAVAVTAAVAVRITRCIKVSAPQR